MATIENKYTGDGSTTKFSITFEYLRETDVKAQIDKVDTDFTFANATTVEFSTAPADTTEVRLFRDTDTDELITQFFPGSAIRAQDLNDNANQVLFVGQEVKERTMVTIGDTMTGDLVMEDCDIVFEGSTIDDNETTLSVIDPTGDHTVKLPNQSGTVPVLASESGSDVQITATPTELNTLDGITATVAELNIMDGVTSTAAEINQLDGATLTNSVSNWTNTAAESTYATAAQIDSRITARINPLGGYEAIANEDSFPNDIPPDGTAISIADADGMVIPASASTTDAQTVGGTAVTIQNIPANMQDQTIGAGIGLIVVSTGASNTYDWHRVVATDADVVQLSDDINDFNARYRPAATTDYTTDNDVGDLYFNTSSNQVRVCLDASGTGSWGNAFVNDAVQKTDGDRSAAAMPVGTTAQRPDDAEMKGYLRFNDDTDEFERHNGTEWGALGAAANGGNDDRIFWENQQTVTANYEIPADTNAGSFGPITINSGNTITIPSTSSWTIV